MKKRKTQVTYITLLLLACGSCKMINTNLSIKENKIPSSFNTLTDTATIAKINWRNYFDDPLLEKLIDTALVNNFDLQIALQKIQITRASVRFSSGELLPKVDAIISGGTTKYPKYTQEAAGNITTPHPDDPTKVVPNPYNDFLIGLTTTWEIDIWGKLKNQRKAATSNYLSSIEGKNFVVSNLVADIAIAYYDLIALDNEFEILQQTIQKQQEALDVVKFQKETGKTNELAVQQFQAQLLNSKALEKETKQQIVETENKINFLLGRFPQIIVRKKEVLFKEIPKQISTGIPSQLLSLRPDIREAAFQLAASKYDLNSAKAAFYPNINLSGALGFQAFNPQFLFSSTASIGYAAVGGLIAPVINRNALKAQFNTAKANQLSAMYNYQKTILNGYVEVVNELSNIQHLLEINLFRKEQSDVLTASVETSTELYKRAKANYLEVLLAQQNSLQTKLEVININKRKQMAIVKVYKALGGGW
jgi:outer membrane protein, multidrug efflux system